MTRTTFDVQRKAAKDTPKVFGRLSGFAAKSRLTK